MISGFIQSSMNHHLNQGTRIVHIALALGAALVLASLAGCSQSSGSSSSASASDAGGEQPTPIERVAAPATQAAPSAEHGQQLFAATCTACHGPQGQGIPHLGKDLRTGKFAAESTDAQLADLIAEGRAANDPLNTTHVPMPPKGGNPALSAQDIFDIVAYVRQLQKQAGTTH